MKAAILALIVALGLGTAFVASVSMSIAGPNDVIKGNYVDDRSDAGH